MASGLVRWYRAYCNYDHSDGSSSFVGNWYNNQSQADAERHSHDGSHHAGSSYARLEWKDLQEGTSP